MHCARILNWGTLVLFGERKNQKPKKSALKWGRYFGKRLVNLAIYYIATIKTTL